MSKLIAGPRFRTPLYAFANTLRNIHFPDDDRELETQFLERVTAGEKWLNVITPTGERPHRSKLWLIRMRLGGKNRYIGTTPRGADAVRFADMAAVRFEKYRKRRTEIDYNFSAEQAAFDQTECPAAAELLDTLEKYFLDNNVIELPAPEKKIERRSRGLRGDMMILHAEIMEALRALDAKIESTRRSSILRVGGATDAPEWIHPVGPGLAPTGPGYVTPIIGDDPNGPKFTC